MRAMATNPTTRKSAEAAEETTEPAAESVADRSERAQRMVAVVGPPLGEDEKPVTVTLSHHLRIGSVDYAPGAKISVAPDYARRLTRQGFTART